MLHTQIEKKLVISVVVLKFFCMNFFSTFLLNEKVLLNQLVSNSLKLF